MPNVIGQTEADARAAIGAAGLTIGLVRVVGSLGQSEPVVLSANHPAGESLPVGTAIEFMLSTASSDQQLPLTLTQGLPTPGALVGDQFSVSVGVTSTYEIVSAAASIAGRQIALSLSGSGSINIAGAPTGPHLLTVRVTDVRGNFAETKITVIHDTRPALTIVSPTPESVAITSLPVDVTCIDDNAGCSVQLLGPWEGNTRVLLAEGVGGVVANVDVSRWSGQRIGLLFRIFDSAEQLTEIGRNIFVETNSRLSPVVTVGGEIVDADSTRLLTKEASNRISIYHRPTTAVESISWYTSLSIQSAQLTPTGAVIRGKDLQSYYETPYQYLWRNGGLETLLPRGTTNEWFHDGGSSSFVVAGDYLVITGLNPRGIYRFNTVTGESLRVADYTGSTTVAADGTVIVSDDGRLLRHRNGQETVVVNDAQSHFNIVMGVGDTVVYAHRPLSAALPQLFAASIIEGTAAPVLLTPSSQDNLVPQHQLAGEWLVYSGWGTQQQRQLFRRDPQRTVTRITDFAASSNLERLADNGDVTLTAGNQRYLSRGNALVPLSSAAGRSFWIDGAWYIAIGSTLFSVDTSDL